MEIVIKKRKKIDKENISGIIMASIPLVGFTLFGLLPMLFAVSMAFLKMKGLTFTDSEFVGLENFKIILSDKSFFDSIKFTFLLTINMPINIVIALLVAFLLSKKIKAEKTFRTIFFIPYVCSIVAVTLMWQWIYNTNFGVLNYWLGRTGDEAINWLGGDVKHFLIAMNIIGMWSGTGFGIILFSAALTNVNSTLYEAAEVDGAGPFTCFFKITLPSISPTSFYLLTMGLIGALQSFAMTNIMVPNGGPNNAGVTMVFYLYRRIFSYANMMGQAAVVSWLLTFIILVVTIINFRVAKKWVNYD